MGRRKTCFCYRRTDGSVADCGCGRGLYRGTTLDPIVWRPSNGNAALLTTHQTREDGDG